MRPLRRREVTNALAWMSAAAASGCAAPAGQPQRDAREAAPGGPSRELLVYAAGSLRAALTQLAADFEAREPGVRVRFEFGASGLLKDRLLAGEAADVFASANMAHPQALVEAGRGDSVQRFARNRLCVLAHPQAGVTAANVIDRLLDPQVRVGTSTPRSDPSGDYTWQLFGNIGARGGRYAGAAARLEAKALQLTGSPGSPKSPDGRSVYTWIVDSGQADVFITYCTGAQQAVTEAPRLQRIELPADVNVAADYGVVLLRPRPAAAPGGGDGASSPAARRFVERLLGGDGQALLARWGFAPA